ncbi:MAG: hypothetical protein ABI342_09000 [Nitrososphaera sp.]
MGIRENQKKGKLGEKDYENYARTMYPHVKRTGRGSDYEIGEVDPFTLKMKKRKVEVKTGKYAKPSKLQKKMKTKIVRMKDLSSDSPSDFFTL